MPPSLLYVLGVCNQSGGLFRLEKEDAPVDGNLDVAVRVSKERVLSG